MRELSDLTIILAEDDPDDGKFLTSSFLKHPSFARVHLVKNGKELVEYLKNANNKKPDVILTDINMPIMNGIEALEELFNNVQLSSVSVFAYSTTVNPAYEARGKAFGIKEFLIKPFSMMDFDEIPSRIVSRLAQDLENDL